MAAASLAALKPDAVYLVGLSSEGNFDEASIGP
jgi:hypothetical protein